MVTKATNAKLHTLTTDSRPILNRAHTLLYAAALGALFYHRLRSIAAATTALSSTFYSLAFAAELIFAYFWITALAFRWRPVRRREFPELLPSREHWPKLDVFICTADPYKEPPLTVTGTAMSALGLDYPPEKLSIYVSDDGGSELTLFGLMEAAKFAKHWLPFCRENGIELRNPDAYFRANNGGISVELKNMYDNMNQRIQNAMDRGHVGEDLVMSGEEYEIIRKFKGFTRRDHPSVIQVLLDNSNDKDIRDYHLPNLVYVSREKHPIVPHHFKAGALNALIRVSGAMTNAPVILTLDCDTYANDPQAPHRALCYLLDPDLTTNLAYVQFPQRFGGVNSNDIYASQMKRLYRINPWGLDGLRGPNYVGTGCFFARRCFYGKPNLQNADYGFANDVGWTNAETVLKCAHDLASCRYENNTKWGSTIGIRYGTLSEDFFTGYLMRCEGWRSVLCDPRKPAFLGDVPKTLTELLNQLKRWAVGLSEVAFSRFSPLFYGTRKDSLLAGLGYAHEACWALWSIPITIYALLLPIALTYSFPLFPKASDPWFYLYVYLFMAANVQDLIEFLAAGGTIKQWWNDQRIWMAKCITSFLFGFADFVLKRIGISTSGFNVTSKVMEDELKACYDKNIFEFGVYSPFLVVLGTVAIMNLISSVVGVLSSLREGSAFNEMFAELFLSLFVVVNCWPLYEAMWLRNDAGRMQKKVTWLSMFLGTLILFIAYFVLV